MKKQKLFEWVGTYLAIEAPVMVGTEKLEGVLPPPDIETERSRKRKRNEKKRERRMKKEEGGEER